MMYDFTTSQRSPEEVENLVYGWLEALGHSQELPCGLAAACGIADALGFVCDPDQVLTLVERGYVTASEGLTLDCQGILDLVVALEARRRWKPGHELHDHKFTQEERQRLRTEADRSDIFRQIMKYDLEYLLGLGMAKSRENDGHAVRTAFQAIRLKLAEIGCLGD